VLTPLSRLKMTNKGEMFEYIKGVIGIRKSNKDRQLNGQNEKEQKDK